MAEGNAGAPEQDRAEIEVDTELIDDLDMPEGEAAKVVGGAMNLGEEPSDIEMMG